MSYPGYLYRSADIYQATANPDYLRRISKSKRKARIREDGSTRARNPRRLVVDSFYGMMILSGER
jgi:hypothetical protein